MRVGIHQLHYLPWLRYFAKIARSDVFVVFDSIQYAKNGWQSRNKVKTAAGATILSVPVHARLGASLDEVEICREARWARKHWRTIEQNYRAAPYFQEHAAFLEATYAQEWRHLNALNRHMLSYFISALGITTRIEYASDLAVPGRATERLVNLVRAVGGDRYYSGAFAVEAYLDAARLEEAGIALELQHWTAPVYPQLHGDFVPDLSIVDLLLNCGPRSLEVLMEGGK